MAETTDRPAAPAPAGPDEAPQPYSSVSLVAVLGFVLAVLYAVIVAVGALLGLFNHTSWILPGWTLALPVAAAAVCAAAGARVRRSEGALTGARLANWGLGLSLVVGVLYLAYYGGTYVAVTSQAKAVADHWFDLVEKGQLDRAFRLTRKPDEQPADDDGLRDRLEMDFDRGGLGREGTLSNFRLSEVVRQIGEGDPKVEFLGVQDWAADPGGFHVDLTYRVSSVGMSNDVIFRTFGVDNSGEAGERAWFVWPPVPLQDRPAAVTEEGKRLETWAAGARQFGQRWLDAVADAGQEAVEARAKGRADGAAEAKAKGEWDEAYLDTLPPAERARQAKERGEAFDAGRKAFLAGAVVQFDPDNFWVGPRDKDPKKAEVVKDRQKQVADAVRDVFGSGRASLVFPRIGGIRYPTIRRDGDQVHFGFDLEIPLADLIIESRVLVAADVSHGDPDPDQWRIESLELISGKSKASVPGAPSPPSAPPPAGSK